MTNSRERTFDTAPASVPAARDFATEILAGWGIFDRLDDVRTCISELATNAVTHGDSVARAFDVCLWLNADRLRVEVWDGGRGQPAPRAADVNDTTGRGLFLVHMLTDAWGVDEYADVKAVWAEFKVGVAGAVT